MKNRWHYCSADRRGRMSYAQDLTLLFQLLNAHQGTVVRVKAPSARYFVVWYTLPQYQPFTGRYQRFAGTLDSLRQEAVPYLTRLSPKVVAQLYWGNQ